MAQKGLLPSPEKVNVLQPWKQDKSPIERQGVTELHSPCQFIQQDMLGVNHTRKCPAIQRKICCLLLKDSQSSESKKETYSDGTAELQQRKDLPGQSFQ